jgi:hypothetical protein
MYVHGCVVGGGGGGEILSTDGFAFLWVYKDCHKILGHSSLTLWCMIHKNDECTSVILKVLLMYFQQWVLSNVTLLKSSLYWKGAMRNNIGAGAAISRAMPVVMQGDQIGRNFDQ